jgi:hypothetical protein
MKYKYDLSCTLSGLFAYSILGGQIGFQHKNRFFEKETYAKASSTAWILYGQLYKKIQLF